MNSPFLNNQLSGYDRVEPFNKPLVKGGKLVGTFNIMNVLGFKSSFDRLNLFRICGNSVSGDYKYQEMKLGGGKCAFLWIGMQLLSQHGTV